MMTSIKNKREQQLVVNHWKEIEEEPVAAILYLHGIGDYISTDETIIGSYAHRSNFFNKNQIMCYGVDFHGHGESEGDKCYIEDFDHLVDDAIALLEIIESEHPNIPVFLFGESMGGAVALQLSIAVQDRIKGMILIAPMVGIHPDMIPSSFVVATLRKLSSIMPRAKLVPGNSSQLLEKCFRDPKLTERCLNDPKKYKGTQRLGTAVSMLDVTQTIQENFENYTAPMLVLHGKEDTVTQPQFSELLVKESASQDKLMKMYDEMYHAMLSEQEWCDIVYPDIIEWITSRVQTSKN